jgi:hypothetical protein
MCVVSMVHDYMRENVQPQSWTYESFNEFKKLLELLDRLDNLLGQPDCVDPEKTKYMEEIEARLKKLEEENEMRKLKEENAELKRKLDRVLADNITKNMAPKGGDGF